MATCPKKTDLKPTKVRINTVDSHEQRLFVYPKLDGLKLEENHFSSEQTRKTKDSDEDFVVIEPTNPTKRHYPSLTNDSSINNSYDFVCKQDVSESCKQTNLEEENSELDDQCIEASDWVTPGFQNKSTASTNALPHRLLGTSQEKPVMMPTQILLDSASKLKSMMTPNYDKAAEEIKAGVMGALNKVKYGLSFNTRTTFSKDNPIHMLGKVYHKDFTDNQSGCYDMEAFKDHFKTLFWFTYRKNFEIIKDSKFTSDAGWGCMLRSVQMILATALTRHFLPSNYIYKKSGDVQLVTVHDRLLEWFSDFDSCYNPFSLHRLVKLGKRLNKTAGNWYGPACASHIVKDAVLVAGLTYRELAAIEVIMAQDGAVYIQDVLDQCNAMSCQCTKVKKRTKEEVIKCTESIESSFLEVTSGQDTCNGSAQPLSLQEEYDMYDELGTKGFDQQKEQRFRSNLSTNYYVPDNHYQLQKNGDSTTRMESSSDSCQYCQNWRSCIIFVPARLGGNEVNPIYHQCVKNLFLHDLCIGIIGGRPKHSLYFVGFQEDYLIHLDPHVCQDMPEKQAFGVDASSFHCAHPRKMDIKKMDPSCTIGFYCHSREQFYRLIEEIPKLVTTRDNGVSSSIFEFVDGNSAGAEAEFYEVVERSDLTTPSSLGSTEELFL